MVAVAVVVVAQVLVEVVYAEVFVVVVAVLVVAQVLVEVVYAEVLVVVLDIGADCSVWCAKGCKMGPQPQSDQLPHSSCQIYRCGR